MITVTFIFVLSIQVVDHKFIAPVNLIYQKNVIICIGEREIKPEFQNSPMHSSFILTRMTDAAVN